MTTDRKAPPRIDGAPGLRWRVYKYGWEARWRARADIVAQGYQVKTRRLWLGVGEPNEVQRAWIVDTCQALQAEMLIWNRGGLPTVGVFDGTVRALIRCYQTDPDSRFHKLRFRTRENYAHLCGRIEKDHGSEYVTNMRARSLLRWHEAWSADGKVAMAHSLMGMLRTVVGFGATFIEDEDCQRVKTILHDMRFTMAKPRTERLTAEQANAIRAMAHQMGRPSIALAQAFQFEAMLRQRDVIGEWIPIGEHGLSDVTSGNEKWLRGLRWEEIDANLILRHTTSKRQKDIEVNLRLAPMVMEELNRLTMGGGMPLPSSGPVVICEPNGVPWTVHEFRRWWRKVADAAGIPKSVKNMDSRAGAISEATDAGAELEHIRHAATHGDISMTQRYSRGSVEKVEKVMQLRSKHRKNKE